jgi:hypothetical protein
VAPSTRTQSDAVASQADPLVQAVPFGGRDPGMVLHELVEQACSGEESPLFAIWGQQLISLWAKDLVPGQRVAFRGVDGVLPFLRHGVRGKCRGGSPLREIANSMQC